MKHVHLIGIGGTGLSAIARVLLESGYVVSGSDRELSALAQQLTLAGAQVFIGHKAENIAGADIVVRSSAVADENVEVRAARDKRIPVLKRAEFLGKIMENKRVIAIAGSHGKTTTSAMIAWILTALDQDPSFILGGILKNLGTNARAGKGQSFVIEADEYDRMFLGLQPDIAVVTNVEHDHPDCFPSPEEFHQAFIDFAQQLLPDGILLVCGDDSGARALVSDVPNRSRSILYGLDSSGIEHLDYVAHDLYLEKNGSYRYTAICAGERLAEVALQVPGKHNVQNSLAALTVAQVLSLPVEQAAAALGEYQGAGRRFEVRGEAGGVIVIDDYAHHPTEIRATIAAARERYPARQLWVVWQPHTYSRTMLLFDQFAGAFEKADHVLVTEVYAAREPAPPDFSAQNVVKAMRHPDANFASDFEQATDFLSAHLKPEAVLLVLSAGDADRISAKVLAARSESEEDYA